MRRARRGARRSFSSGISELSWPGDSLAWSSWIGAATSPSASPAPLSPDGRQRRDSLPSRKSRASASVGRRCRESWPQRRSDARGASALPPCGRARHGQSGSPLREYIKSLTRVLQPGRPGCWLVRRLTSADGGGGGKTRPRQPPARQRMTSAESTRIDDASLRPHHKVLPNPEHKLRSAKRGQFTTARLTRDQPAVAKGTRTRRSHH